jgi:hypothetical protein
MNNGGNCYGNKFGSSPTAPAYLYPRAIPGWTFTGFTVTTPPPSGTLSCDTAKCAVGFGDGVNVATAVITANYTQTTANATLNINVNAVTPNGYTAGDLTFTSSPNTLGGCGSAPVVTMNTSSGAGSISCASGAGFGIGYDKGTMVTAPDLTAKGYDFSGWTRSGSWSGIQCTSTDPRVACVNLAPGQTGTITAAYKPRQALLDVRTAGVSSATMKAVNHGIGYCAAANTTFSAPQLCYSAPGMPIGMASDGIATYVHPEQIVGYTFTGWTGGYCSGTGDCRVDIPAGSGAIIVANYQQAATAKLYIYMSGAPQAAYISSSPHMVGSCNYNFYLYNGSTTLCESAGGFGIGYSDGTLLTAPQFANYSVSWSGNANLRYSSSCGSIQSPTGISTCINLAPGETAYIYLTYTYSPPAPAQCRSYTYPSALCIRVSGRSDSYVYSDIHSVGSCNSGTGTGYAFYVPRDVTSNGSNYTQCEGYSFGTPDGLYIYPYPGIGYFAYWSVDQYPSSGSLYCSSTWCYVNYGSYLQAGAIKANYYY